MIYIVKRGRKYYGPFHNIQAASIFASPNMGAEVIELEPMDVDQAAAMRDAQARPFNPFGQGNRR